MSEASSATHRASRDEYPPTVRLTASTARRISHQIERAVQGTYGARDGLRELVHLGTQQMLVAGASRETIRHEIALCVSARTPTVITTEPALSRHRAEMMELTTLMLTWADECPAPARTR